jgi:hypothetical protein
MDALDLDSLATNYMHWYGPATFLRCPYQPDLEDTDIGLIGVPYSGGNPIERISISARGRCGIAPRVTSVPTASSG